MSNFIRSRCALVISVAGSTISLLAVLVVIVICSEGSEPENSLILTEDQARKAGYYVPPIPQKGDPYCTIVIELESGDIILEKGFYDVEGTTEVIRLTHTGFIVVGEHKIHIDTFATVVERLAIAHGKAVTK